MVTHLVGFGGGAGGFDPNDVTSYLLDGTLDRLTTPDSSDWDIVASASESWTIHLFIKYSGAPSGTDVLVEQAESDADRWTLQHNSSSSIGFNVKTGNTNVLSVSGGTAISDQNWHHIALIKVLDKYGTYLDGTQIAYVQDSSTDTFAAILTIGTDVSGTQAFPGYIDDLVIDNTNIFSAAPNSTPNDTIVVPTVANIVAANLHISCGEPIVTGTTGSGATFVSNKGGHTITEVANAIRDTSVYKF